MGADDDRALQPERTGLAWVRTLIVMAGIWALVSFHLFLDHGLSATAVATTIIGGLVLVSCGWIGTARGRRARRDMVQGSAVTVPLELLALSAASAIVAIIAFASTATIP